MWTPLGSSYKIWYAKTRNGPALPYQINRWQLWQLAHLGTKVQWITLNKLVSNPTWKHRYPIIWLYSKTLGIKCFTKSFLFNYSLQITHASPLLHNLHRLPVSHCIIHLCSCLKCLNNLSHAYLFSLLSTQISSSYFLIHSSIGKSWRATGAIFLFSLGSTPLINGSI